MLPVWLSQVVAGPTATDTSIHGCLLLRTRYRRPPDMMPDRVEIHAQDRLFHVQNAVREKNLIGVIQPGAVVRHVGRGIRHTLYLHLVKCSSALEIAVLPRRLR